MSTLREGRDGASCRRLEFPNDFLDLSRLDVGKRGAEGLFRSALRCLSIVLSDFILLSKVKAIVAFQRRNVEEDTREVDS